jgi:CRISPR-associated protein Cas1
MAEIRQNTLYITTDGLYLHNELEVLKVEKDRETLLKVPFHHIGAIAIMAHSNVSPSVMQKCLQKGIAISFLTPRGRFLGRVEGRTSSSVLLRKEQVLKSEDEEITRRMAVAIIAGKLQNARLNLLRSARETTGEEGQSEPEIFLRDAAEYHLESLEKLKHNPTLETARGVEGDCAKKYFSVFDHSLKQQREDFTFERRTRRPPRSRVNCLLSFLYAIWTNDCVSACQSVGLDPYVGFLHKDRPGRPSLALDLVEEFRPMADRLAITLINRKQVTKEDFQERPGSVYNFTEAGKKKILAALQERKQDEITHGMLNQKMSIAQLPPIQAQILSRVIRGDIDEYKPFIWR